MKHSLEINAVIYPSFLFKILLQSQKKVWFSLTHTKRTDDIVYLAEDNVFRYVLFNILEGRGYEYRRYHQTIRINKLDAYYLITKKQHQNHIVLMLYTFFPYSCVFEIDVYNLTITLYYTLTDIIDTKWVGHRIAHKWFSVML